MPSGERVVAESVSPWKRVVARPSPKRNEKEASLGNARFEATHDGLVRHIGVASPHAEAVSSLAFNARGLRPTGNVCKMASGTWVQVAVGRSLATRRRRQLGLLG
jgi:hypothetical protein